jgi:hypothetical protein
MELLVAGLDNQPEDSPAVLDAFYFETKKLVGVVVLHPASDEFGHLRFEFG